MTSNRLEPAERKKRILEAAIRLARTGGHHAITCAGVAVKAGVSFTLVTHYFGNIDGLRLEVMSEAIAREIPEIVANGLATGYPLALSAPTSLKAKAIAVIFTP